MGHLLATLSWLNPLFSAILGDSPRRANSPFGLLADPNVWYVTQLREKGAARRCDYTEVFYNWKRCHFPWQREYCVPALPAGISNRLQNPARAGVKLAFVNAAVKQKKAAAAGPLLYNDAAQSFHCRVT
jgi:hypothetical protein